MTVSRRSLRSTEARSTTDPNNDRKGALVRRMRPLPSTPAIAIGVELKKRVKRTSEARRSAVASSPLARLSTMVRLAPGTPSRLAMVLCMKRTGSASPPPVNKSRSITALRTEPGSAFTERISAMPSPATISGKVTDPGVKLARSMPSHSASVAFT